MEEREDMAQIYKNRLMAHDIHRVRELSALLEERRRYFDGQLGEVYRNAGVSSPTSSVPRLRSLNSPPASASDCSNMTNVGFLGGHNNNSDHLSTTGGGSIELNHHHHNHHSSARSCYSVFADDECSLADSFDYAETKARLGRNWSSSTLLVGANQMMRGGHGGKAMISGHAGTGAGVVVTGKDSIQNEMMRTADLEKKLKARRSSLPLALEASLKRPVRKKVFTKTVTKGGGGNKDKLSMMMMSSSRRPEVNLQAIAASLLTKASSDSSAEDDDGGDDGPEDDSYASKPRKFSSQSGGGGGKLNKSLINSKKMSQPNFSMTETLSRLRKFDVSQDLKRTLGLPPSKTLTTLRLQGKPSSNNKLGNINNNNNNSLVDMKGSLLSSNNWDGDTVGEAPRMRPKYKSKSNNSSNVTTMTMSKSMGSSSSFSKSASSTLTASAAAPPPAPVSESLLPILVDNYSPRSSMSTVTGSCPKIAFSFLEKSYREEQGDKARLLQLHPSHLLWKPVTNKTDVSNVFEEPSDEPDYSHDFRYLSLLDALIPCFEQK